MRGTLLSILSCPCCNARKFLARHTFELYNEWRKGHIECLNCGRSFLMDDGIVNFLAEPSPEILKEQQASISEVRIRTPEGEGFCVTPESIERFSKVFISLPEGDGSYFFKKGGPFQNFAEGAHRFYELIDKFGIEPGMKILEIGAGFCWASREFAKRDCDVVAIDITNYLKVADLYLKDGLFFERAYADMDHLPFVQESFDIVFAAAAIHHSSDLLKTFKELRRVLKNNGRLILLNECFIGVFEKPKEHGKDYGFNDHYYPLPYWRGKIRQSGFRDIRVSYLSFIKDYVARKEARETKPNLKLRLAKGIIKYPFLDKLISSIFIPLRILFRPKSILIQAVKGSATVVDKVVDKFTPATSSYQGCGKYLISNV